MQSGFLRKLCCVCLLTQLAACGGGSPDAANANGAGNSGGGGPGPGPTTQQLEALGEKLFKDVNFSNPPLQSCHSCHDANSGFADPDQAVAVSEGAFAGRFGTRNSPTVSYAAFIPIKSSINNAGVITHSGGQFLDGRSPRLEHQAQQPFLNIIEMNMLSKMAVIDVLKTAVYVDEFKAAYGDNILDDVDAAYVRISEAIAKFERSDAVSPFSSKFDDVKNGLDVFNVSEANGEQVFIDSNCGRCHAAQGFNPVFSNFQYENIGVPSNNIELVGISMDSSASLIDNSFIDRGLGSSTGIPVDDGKFRVPTLRNVELTAPYMHNGVFDTLEQVVEFYDSRNPALAEVPTTVPMDEIGNLGLTLAEKADLVAFLKTLTDR